MMTLCYFILPFISVFSMAMLIPLYPALADIFQRGAGEIGLIPNIGFVSLFLLTPAIGSLIRWFNPRRLLLGGLVFWLAGILIEALALIGRNLEIFALGRVVQAVGDACFYPVLLRSIAALNRRTSRKKASSLLEIGGSSGGVLGPFLAGFSGSRPELLFFVLLFLGAAVLLFTARVFRPELPVFPVSLSRDVSGSEPEDPSYRGTAVFCVWLSAFSVFMLFSGCQTYLAFFLGIFGVTRGWIGTFTSLSQILLVAGSAAALRFSGYSFHRVVILLFLFMALSLSGLSFVRTAPGAYALLSVIFLLIGMGLAVSNYWLGEYNLRHRERNITVYMMLRYCGAFVASFVIGRLLGYGDKGVFSYEYLFDRTYQTMALYSVCVTLVLWLLFRKRSPQKRRHSFV